MFIIILIFSYKHAIDGLIQVARSEGIFKLFNGAEWAASRAVLVTVGQLCFYDVIKAKLLDTPYFEDNLTLHFTSSLGAVSVPIYFRLFFDDIFWNSNLNCSTYSITFHTKKDLGIVTLSVSDCQSHSLTVIGFKLAFLFIYSPHFGLTEKIQNVVSYYFAKTNVDLDRMFDCIYIC